MKKLIIIFSLFCFISVSLSGQHWYIDNTGTGDTLATIAEVNALTLGSDDTVSFKKGCLWRDDIVLDQSGTSGHYIVFNTYGTGAKPKIYGSDQALNFTDRGGNVWSSATTLANPFAGDDMEVWFIETDDSVKWGDQEADTASLAAEYDWAWASNVLYVYAATDPDSRYTSVECPQRYYMFNYNSQQYIEVNGFEMAYGLSAVRSEDNGDGDYTGAIVRNNVIHHLGTKDGGGYGIFVVYNNMLFKDNEIYECGRRGVSLYNYGNDTIENIIVDGNYFHDNYHTTGVDISSGGSDPIGSFDSIIIRNNFFEDDDSLLLSNPPSTTYLRTEGTAHTNKLYFYNNVFMYVYGVGLNFDGDAGSSGFNDVYIYNNTFYGFNKVMSDGRMFIDMTGVAGGEWVLKNNIFYLDNDPEDRYGYCFSFDGLTYDQIESDYNLYYTTIPASYIIRQVTPLVRYTTAQFATMQSTWGWEVNSPNPADPLFINVTDPVEVDSLMIGDSSPADSAGISLGAFTTYDYRDSVRANPPDIGAFDFGGTSPSGTYPSVTTTTPVAIYTRLVAVGGSGLDAGGGTITAKGVCYSTSANPTISDSKVSGGTGTDAFGVLIDVKANTTYHFRAYVTNAEGTAYGSDLTVTTPIHSVAKTGGKILKTGGKIVQIH